MCGAGNPRLNLTVQTYRVGFLIALICSPTVRESDGVELAPQKCVSNKEEHVAMTLSCVLIVSHVSRSMHGVTTLGAFPVLLVLDRGGCPERVSYRCICT